MSAHLYLCVRPHSIALFVQRAPPPSSYAHMYTAKQPPTNSPPSRTGKILYSYTECIYLGIKQMLISHPPAPPRTLGSIGLAQKRSTYLPGTLLIPFTYIELTVGEGYP